MDNNENKKINEDESVVRTKQSPTLKINLTEPETKENKKQEITAVYKTIIIKTKKGGS